MLYRIARRVVGWAKLIEDDEMFPMTKDGVVLLNLCGSENV